MTQKKTNHGLIPKKSLGQHFLKSEKVLGQIIDASKLLKGDVVLEIGPGTGVLTDRLLSIGASVIAIEKDVRAFTLLTERFAKEISGGKLQLIHGDILTVDLRDILEKRAVSMSYKIVANIPYYITGAILERFLEHAPRPKQVTLLVQKEVAERIVAKDNKESILSISVKAFGTPRIIAKVPRGAFLPPPSVDSAILNIEDISGKRFVSDIHGDEINEEEQIKIEKFFKILKSGFAHKRKYLKRNLEKYFTRERLDNVWEKSKFDPKIRPEDLALDQWLEISSNI